METNEQVRQVLSKALEEYREIKAGAVFRAERGSKREELAPGV